MVLFSFIMVDITVMSTTADIQYFSNETNRIIPIKKKTDNKRWKTKKFMKKLEEIYVCI